MAAGTAASLVPIRSITRRMGASDAASLVNTVKSHPRLTADSSKNEETVTYIADTQEDAGVVCLKLLGQLKGIQSGKVEDTLGWCYKITENDGKKAQGHEVVTNGSSGKEEPGVAQRV